MANIIRPRLVTEVTTYSLFFCFTGERNWGYEFDCNAEGAVVDAAHPSYLACLTGAVDGRKVDGGEVREWTRREITPAMVQCGNHTHELTNDNRMGDSQCECGQWWNACGQRLSDPCNWGEETGETFDDSGHFVHGDFHDYGPEGA